MLKGNALARKAAALPPHRLRLSPGESPIGELDSQGGTRPPGALAIGAACRQNLNSAFRHGESPISEHATVFGTANLRSEKPIHPPLNIIPRIY